MGRVPAVIFGNFKVPYDELEMSHLVVDYVDKVPCPTVISSPFVPRGVNAQSGRESCRRSLSLVSRLTSSFASWMELQQAFAAVTGTANITQLAIQQIIKRYFP
jgi:hypothetical protein